MIVADCYIVKENLVDVAVATSKLDRTNVDSRRLHVDPEIGQALVLGDIGVGPDDDDAIVAILRPAGPQFLAVDFPAIAIGFGFCSQAGQIRSASYWPKTR